MVGELATFSGLIGPAAGRASSEGYAADPEAGDPFINCQWPMVYRYQGQTVNTIGVYSGTVRVDRPRARESTSGRRLMLGKHVAKAWSSAQPNRALRAAGFKPWPWGQAVACDLGAAHPLRVWTDSSAAMGLVVRQGFGKITHLYTRTPCVQQAARTGRIEHRKDKCIENPAGLFAKFFPTVEQPPKLIELFGCEVRVGCVVTGLLWPPWGI